MAQQEELQNLEQEIEAIKERNHRVEGDKAWEISYFRIGLISVLTYIIVAVFLYFIGISTYLVSALIPVFGFILSTQSVPVLKKWWLNKRYGQ